jgi:hypothetical protein
MPKYLEKGPVSSRQADDAFVAKRKARSKLASDTAKAGSMDKARFASAKRAKAASVSSSKEAGMVRSGSAKPAVAKKTGAVSTRQFEDSVAAKRKASSKLYGDTAKAGSMDKARVKGMKKDTTGSSAGGFRKADQASSKGVKPMTSRAVSSRQAEDQVVARRKARNSAGSVKKITRLPSTK